VNNEHVSSFLGPLPACSQRRL